MTLTNIRGDNLGQNVAIIDGLRHAVGQLSDGAPFLLLPVRIETRFIRREAPRPDGDSVASIVIENLTALVTSLELIAGAEFKTELKGAVKAKKSFKRNTENPLYNLLDQRITNGTANINQINLLLDDAGDGTAAQAEAVATLIKRGAVALERASKSIGKLRSPYQRERFQKAFEQFRKSATATFDQIRTRLIPTLTMVNRLRTRDRLRPPQSKRGDVLPVARLADSADYYQRVSKRLSDINAAFAAASKTMRRLDRSSRFAKDITESAVAATAEAGAMVLIPGDWKTGLIEKAVEARRAGERLAAALTRGAIGGGEATTSVRAQARALTASLTDVEKAIQAVRSDDQSLDSKVGKLWRDTPVELPGRTRIVNELWVRIFPDDVAVETHETSLTSFERDSGQTFWRETLDAGGNDTLLRGAWRALCEKHDSNRAAWIAQETEPPQGSEAPDAKAGANIIDALTAFDRRLEEVSASEPGLRLKALTRAAERALKSISDVKTVPHAMLPIIRRKLEVIRAKVTGADLKARGHVKLEGLPLNQLGPALQKLESWLADVTEADAHREERRVEFGEVKLKDGSWTRAPRSNVLPGRFVVITANDDRASHVVACEPVNPKLKLGLDPDPANAATEQYSLDANGNLVAGESIRWMVDFEEAVKSGMGVKIPITADEARTGFDRIYALGVRTDDREEGRRRVEALLDNHHYGQSGLSLVPIGTPTNNTEAETAGYRSTDDPDESYGIERGPSLFDPAAAPAEAADGLRLARALGIDPNRLIHVAQAGGQDVNEALLMNQVLWPATFGNYLEEFFGSLLPIETRDWIAEYALANVTARGPIPSLCVGAQPYGVLATTAFSLYVPSTGPAQFPEAPANQKERRALFNRLLRDVLLLMLEDWTALRVTHVKHAHSAGVTNFQQHFLDMLGLEATSASSAYRLSLNCARRHPPVLPDDLLDFGAPRSAPGAAPTASAYGPVALLERFSDVFRDALQLGPGDLLVDGRVSEVFEKAHKRLLHSRAYEVRHLREPKPLLGESVGSNVAAWIQRLLDAAPVALVSEARTSSDTRPLLYLLIRQALLTQARETTLRILAREHMLTDEARRLASSSDEFLVSTLSKDYAVTQWNYLFARLSELDGRFGITFPAGAGTFFNYLQSGSTEKTMADYLQNRGDNALFRGFAGRARHAPFVQALVAHAADTQRLAQIPAMRLEQLLYEHLDVVSYRLDAWLIGLATQRLAEMREATPRGVYLGAYGWVEDLRPDAAHPLASGVPAALISDAQPIYTDVENQGFIHAPSLNHAVTAAILRSGYLSEAKQPDVENRMAVNLSSRRVRLALALIDGVRAGNDLGSLLGYQFERFLHEAYATEGITLDDLIGPLRRAFPSTAPVDQNLSSPEAARQIVIDGLALHQTVQAWVQDNAGNVAPGATLFDILYDGGSYSLYPFGLQAKDGEVLLPPITSATGRRRLDGILRALDKLADAVDAVGDLVVSEGVYQIAQGNHVRAAAAVSALAQGKAPPRPEIVDTPRSGTVISQRLFLQFSPVATLPQGWEDVPATPRAAAEPSLNNWLGLLLGPPEDLWARIFDQEGAEIRAVTAADLGMQPIDLLAVLGPGFDEGFGKFAARILDVQRPADVDDNDPPPRQRVELQRDEAWAPEVKSFVEIAPLLESVWELLTRGRAATTHDWVLEEIANDGGALASGSLDKELSERVTASLESLRAMGVTLLKLLSNDADDDPALLSVDPRAYVLSRADVYMTTFEGRRAFRDLDALWARRNELIDTLIDAASFGFAHVDPPVAYPKREEVARELLEKLETAFIEIATRVQNADKELASLPATGSQIDGLTATAKAVFGEAFVILPHFQLRNPETIARAITAKLAPINDPSLDGWLHGVAAVRANAARLARVIVLADAFGVAAPRGLPVQLPHVDGDVWLGAKLPPDYQPVLDRLSLVAFGADALDTAGGANVGMLVDQWTEIIPPNEETTGVAIYYDQPDAIPPQCLLLAVPPERRGKWRWEDLVLTLHETLELAKNRAIELEHLHHDLYGQILPGVVGELVPVDLPVVEGVPDSRVILDFGRNNPNPPT